MKNLLMKFQDLMPKQEIGLFKVCLSASALNFLVCFFFVILILPFFILKKTTTAVDCFFILNIMAALLSLVAIILLGMMVRILGKDSIEPGDSHA